MQCVYGHELMDDTVVAADTLCTLYTVYDNVQNGTDSTLSLKVYFEV